MSSEHGHDNHPPHLAHHFETPKQQFESGKLGMWVFLATEILMFGGLFCAYSIYRGNHQDVFLYGYGALNKYWGATNTVVLLASSLTMAWGVRAAQKGQQKLLLAMLIATFMGGVGFMCIKTIEYKAKWDHGLFPGTMNAFYYKNGAPAYPDKIEHAIAYIDAHNTGGHAPAHGGEHLADAHAEAPAHDEHAAPEAASEASEAHAETAEGHTAVIIPAAFGAPADVSLIPHPAVTTETGLLDTAIDNAGVTVLPHAGHTQRVWASLSPEEQGKVHIFFAIYFLMTGLHGLHVLIGMAVILWLIIKAAKGTFGKEYFTPVDIGGLYWHLVDLIWIFLFPLLYLIH
ncbi:MAG: cytochrome c oxidase subunit 3 [Phycisphaerales bacterium]